MMDTQDPWLLHFTHVDNLESVARTGLVADNLQPPLVVECAEQGIKELRRTRSVPIGPLGVVADYVPFYASNLAWVASDRNAALATARFTATQRELATHIDWALMEAEYWANTDEDGSRVQRRMAELLVHERVPWMAFSRVYAQTESVAAVAREIVGLERRPSAEVRAHWYF
ncbi:DUF4433 domain-containing protein [Nonomuraea purpurea]|uniref:DUF4433 domain-containing protein n=1 Tax=Nonomuraea purpurea TaxID=1849276 RepID=A0ABV8GKK4_9ACTN